MIENLIVNGEIRFLNSSFWAWFYLLAPKSHILKTLFNFKFVGPVLVLLFIALSCSTTKKTAVSCPELPRNNLENQVATKNYKHNQKTFNYTQREIKGKQPSGHHSLTAKANQKNKAKNNNELNKSTNYKNITQLERISKLQRVEYKNGLIASLNNTNIPSLQPYSSGSQNTKDVLEIEKGDINNGSDTKLRISTNPILNSDKNLVKTTTKSKESNALNENSFFHQEGPNQQESTIIKVEGLGLAGMIVGLAGLLVLPIPCGIVAVIFGAISLARFKKNPNKYRGKGFAVTALVVGLVVLTLGIILLAGAVWKMCFKAFF